MTRSENPQQLLDAVSPEVARLNPQVFGKISPVAVDITKERKACPTIKKPPLPKAPRESEADFQQTVIDLLHVRGWTVAHFRPARIIDDHSPTGFSWRTPVSADGKGFPDLIALKGSDLLVAEIKSEKGKVSADQQRWLDLFRDCGAIVCIWRPSAWEIIVKQVE